MKKLTLLIVASVGIVGLLGLYNMTNSSVANAATTANSKLSQTINPGVLSTDIRNSSNVVVNNPTFSMAAKTVSFSQQTSTGTFGDNQNRIYVENPGAANNGWTLTLNALQPGSGEWRSAGSDTYKYNANATTGQLTVNPSAGTITPVIGSGTGVLKNAATAFSGSNPVRLMTASASADKVWAGYITGIGLTQAIPASQPAGTYTLPMVQTITAL